MDGAVFVVLGFGVVLVLGVAIAMFILRRRRQSPVVARSQGDALAAMERDEGVVRQGETVSRTYRGVRFVAQRVTGKHARFWITVKGEGGDYPREFVPTDEETWSEVRRVRHQPRMVFSRETPLRQFWSRVGLNRKYRTGDAGFDEAIHIDTLADAELVASVCRRRESRDAIRRMIVDGYAQVTVFGHDAPLVVESTAAPPSVLDGARRQAQQEAMVVLLGGLPRIEVERAGRLALGRHSWVAALALGVGLLGFVAKMITHGLWPEFGMALEGRGMVVGLLGLVVMLPLLFLAVRGFASSGTAFLVGAAGLLVGLPLLGGVGATAANALFDESSPRQVPATVVETSSSSGKSGTSYYVTLRSGDEEDTFQVDRGFYYCAYRGQKVDLTVRRGALGWPWIDRVKSEDRTCRYDW